jgi:hypothetical protein
MKFISSSLLLPLQIYLATAFYGHLSLFINASQRILFFIDSNYECWKQNDGHFHQRGEPNLLFTVEEVLCLEKSFDLFNYTSAYIRNKQNVPLFCKMKLIFILIILALIPENNDVLNPLLKSFIFFTPFQLLFCESTHPFKITNLFCYTSVDFPAE